MSWPWTVLDEGEGRMERRGRKLVDKRREEGRRERKSEKEMED